MPAVSDPHSRGNQIFWIIFIYFRRPSFCNVMSLSVSSFPSSPSKLTSSPTWGKGPSPTTKRWTFGGRLNTGSASLMKGIRHIGKVQLKSSVGRFAHKPSSQNSPRLSVRASTIVIDIIAVPHDDKRQSSADTSHDDPAPAPTSPPKQSAYPLLARIPRTRANSSGAALEAAQRARIRVNSEAAKATCGSNTSPALSVQVKTKEIGPKPDLPVVTFTLADDCGLDGSPSSVTTDWKDKLPNGFSDTPSHETRHSLRRTMSSPTIKHSGNWDKIQPPPPSPLPPSLLSVHIAQLRTGSRPVPTPLHPLLAVGPRSKTAPTTRVPKLPPVPRIPTRHCSTREVVDSSSRASQSNLNLTRSRSQPQLRAAKRSARASASGGTLSRSGSTSSSAFTQEGHTRSSPPVSYVRGYKWAREERCPRSAFEPGYVAWPMSPIVVMDPKTTWEMRQTGAAVARQQARHHRQR